MSAKNKKTPAPRRTPDPVPAAANVAAVAVETSEPFYQRHPKIAQAIFVALCVYVAMLWLLALDQTFHWGLFGPKLPPTS